MVDAGVIGTVRRYLSALREQGVPVRFGVVYGSQATGRAGEWSDIDLLVVSPRYDQPFTHKDAMLLWRVAVHIDSRIEPLPCGEKQWREDDASHIIEIGRREGEKVLP
jgi:predicted nucleotidyltransferase